jgi:hypothetical protein
LLNNLGLTDAAEQARESRAGVRPKASSMHDKQKLAEKAVIGLVVAAISINILATELPRLLPYLVVLVMLFIVVRLVLYHTNKW